VISPKPDTLVLSFYFAVTLVSAEPEIVASTLSAIKSKTFMSPLPDTVTPKLVMLPLKLISGARHSCIKVSCVYSCFTNNISSTR